MPRVNLTFDLRSAWCVLRGTPRDLVTIQHTLDAWAAQQRPEQSSSTGDPVCFLKDGDLWVLAGAFLAALPDIGSATVNTLEGHLRETVAECAYRLEKVGLLRDYQARAVESAWLAPCFRSILDLAPGAGKTRIMLGVMAVGAKLSRVHPEYVGCTRTLQLVHSPSIMEQTEKEIGILLPTMLDALEAGPAHGCKQLTILCTTYTRLFNDAGARLRVRDYDLLLVDECHRVGGRQAVELLLESRALLRCGLSGTPLGRMDTRNPFVIGLLGPVLERVDASELISNGHLAEGLIN